jgi:pyruvoyl-dependent arginine decarboxylase (PvlArgDC)
LVSTDGGPGGVSEYAVYSQDERADRVTTSSGSESVSVSTCSINGVAAPRVWQLVCTDGCSGGISEYAVYGQYEVDNRIATSAAGEGVSVSAGNINNIATPCVW